MEAEKRKILEGIHDLLKSMPQDCLGTGEGAAGWIWPIRDEVMDNLCKVMAEPTWTRIDPEDESTWPAEASHIWLGLPLAMTSLHYWLRKDAAELDGFYHKPANIPDPPEDTG